MKKDTVLLSINVGEFKIENTQLFNGLYRVKIWENGVIHTVLKSGSITGNQKNLREAAVITGMLPQSFSQAE